MAATPLNVHTFIHYVYLLLHRSLTAVHGGLSSSVTGHCGQYLLHTSAWTGPTTLSCSGCRRTWQGTSELTSMISCSLPFHIYSTRSLVSVSRALVYFTLETCDIIHIRWYSTLNFAMPVLFFYRLMWKSELVLVKILLEDVLFFFICEEHYGLKYLNLIVLCEFTWLDLEHNHQLTRSHPSSYCCKNKIFRPVDN